MPILRECLERGCHVLVMGSGRCVKHEREEAQRRAEEEPWRALYDDPRWRSKSMQIKARDEYRCRDQYQGRRCAVTGMTGEISVHHVRKLRLLWDDAGGDYERFVRLALDENNLVTLCARHHLEADRSSHRTPPHHAKNEIRRNNRRARKWIQKHSNNRDREKNKKKDRRSEWQ